MGVWLADLITRIRGNPVVLATLLVAVVAACVGVPLAKSNADVLSGALIGAAASSLSGLLITFLGEPDLKAVPQIFLEAVKHELTQSGYYRTNHRYVVEVTEDRGIASVRIVFSSRIVPVKGRLRVGLVQVAPPSGFSLVKGPEYMIDGFLKTADFEIDKVSAETCSIMSQPKVPGTITVTDTHRWNSPIDGFALIARLPDGYAITATSLAGLSLEEERAYNPGERIFSQKEVAFSQQGFVWTIKKIDA